MGRLTVQVNGGAVSVTLQHESRTPPVQVILTATSTGITALFADDMLPAVFTLDSGRAQVVGPTGAAAAAYPGTAAAGETQESIRAATSPPYARGEDNDSGRDTIERIDTPVMDGVPAHAAANSDELVMDHVGAGLAEALEMMRGIASPELHKALQALLECNKEPAAALDGMGSTLETPGELSVLCPLRRTHAPALPRRKMVLPEGTHACA